MKYRRDEKTFIFPLKEMGAFNSITLSLLFGKSLEILAYISFL